MKIRKGYGLEGLNKKDLTVVYNEKVLNSLLDNTISKKDFLGLKPIKLADKVKEPFAVMGLSFVAESKVGLWTNKAMRICSATPESLLEKIEKAFPHIGKEKVEGKGYSNIFRLNVNDHFMVLADDTVYSIEVKYVSNREINLFDRNIKSLDIEALTVEDVKKIQDDLWHLFRAWQESSIDMTKDKTKAFNKSMDDVLGNVKTIADLSADDFTDNIYSILKTIENNIVNEAKEDVNKYEIDINVEKLDQEKLVETSLSKFRMTEASEIQDFFNKTVVPHLENCNIDRWKEIASQYKNGSQAVMRLAYMISQAFKALSEARVGNVLPSYYKIVRDGIYTWANMLEISEEDVVGIAVMAIMYNIVYNKQTGAYTLFNGKIKENIKMSLLELVFGDIITAKYLEDEDGCRTMMYDLRASDLRYIYRDICDGDVYSVIDGIAYDSETDDVCFQLKDTEYSGEIFVLGDRLLKTVDVYEEYNIRKDIIMLVADSHKVKDRNKWIDAGNNVRTIEEMKKGGDFSVMQNKSGKVMIVKDSKDILCTVNSCTSPDLGETKKEDIDNLFFIGHNSDEPWIIDGKEVEKSGTILVFDVDADEYFDDEDIEFIQRQLRVEDRQEQSGRKIK